MTPRYTSRRRRRRSDKAMFKHVGTFVGCSCGNVRWNEVKATACRYTPVLSHVHVETVDTLAALGRLKKLRRCLTVHK